MFKNFFLAALLMLCAKSIFSQVDVSVRVKQSFSNGAKLYLYKHKSTELVDSTFRLAQGIFKFRLPKGFTPGVYKFALNKNISFDFVVANEPNVEIETFVFAAEDSLKAIISEENAQFFKFLKIKKRFIQKSYFLNSLIDYYSEGSSFYNKLKQEVENTQLEYNMQLKAIVDESPLLLSSSFIRLEIRPLGVEKKLAKEKRIEMRGEWWKNVSLSDSRLCGSPSLDSRLWGYINLYIDENSTREHQDSLFVEGCKAIMSLDACVDIKGYFREILFKSYIDSDYDGVTKYLYESNFIGLQKIILSDEEDSAYKVQQKNGIGTSVYDFSLKLPNDSKVKLSNVNATYKLIVFWSMWCPHCTAMIPELYGLYHKYKSDRFEVIAVCIDEEVDDWKKYLVDNHLNWTNAIEPDDGASRVIKEYNVDGTPKMLLIDSKMKVISRPANVSQVDSKLKSLSL